MVLAGFPTGRDLEVPGKKRHGSDSQCAQSVSVFDKLNA